jgi:hypothetical protein
MPDLKSDDPTVHEKTEDPTYADRRKLCKARWRPSPSRLILQPSLSATRNTGHCPRRTDRVGEGIRMSPNHAPGPPMTLGNIASWRTRYSSSIMLTAHIDLGHAVRVTGEAHFVAR